MEYIETEIGLIDVEEVEETLNSGDITIDDVLKVWDTYEDTYDIWAKMYGAELIKEWFDEHGCDESQYAEAMVYGIREFVKWVNMLN